MSFSGPIAIVAWWCSVFARHRRLDIGHTLRREQEDRLSRDGGNENFARTYATPGAVPTTLIIDKAGRIAVTHIGFCSKREYEADTQTLLAEH